MLWHTVKESGSCLTQLSGILVSQKELFMSGMKDQRANMPVIACGAGRSPL